MAGPRLFSTKVRKECLRREICGQQASSEGVNPGEVWRVSCRQRERFQQLVLEVGGAARRPVDGKREREGRWAGLAGRQGSGGHGEDPSWWDTRQIQARSAPSLCSP